MHAVAWSHDIYVTYNTLSDHSAYLCTFYRGCFLIPDLMVSFSPLGFFSEYTYLEIGCQICSHEPIGSMPLWTNLSQNSFTRKKWTKLVTSPVSQAASAALQSFCYEKGMNEAVFSKPSLRDDHWSGPKSLWANPVLWNFTVHIKLKKAWDSWTKIPFLW